MWAATEAKEKNMGGAYGAAFRDAIDYDHNRTVQERINEIDGFLIPSAQTRNDEAQRVYRMAKKGALAGMVMIPLGVIGLGLSILGGLPHGLAEFLSTLSLGSAGVGAGLKFFLCSPARVKELQRRAEQAQRELDDLIYERDSLARTIR